jgi:uncharacterized protein
MDALQLVVLGALAFVAGAVNSLAGGGSLLTFPLLVALGLPPLTANVTNSLGHAPGYVSIVAGLRDGLAGQRRRVVRALPATVGGAVAGAVLLAACSPHAFAAAAPLLVVTSAGLLTFAWRGITPAAPLVAAGVLTGSIYASFFGAGAGFVVLAALSGRYDDGVRRLNALSRLLICIANLVALPLIVALNPFDLAAAAVMWPTTLLGGYAGARATRRMHETVLRRAVICLALVAAAYLLVRL